MMSGKRGVRPGFGPSERILVLARHKTSKTVWATTPCEQIIWGNQDPIRPISCSALRASPSPRIQYLSRHKRDFSAGEEQRGKEEEEDEEEVSVFRKTRHPSSKTFEYENILRLSTPRPRSRGPQEAGRPHTSFCERICPIWHVDPRVKNAVITPRLLQLSEPKRTHPDHQNNKESAASVVSFASRTASASQRLVRLSRPKLRESNVCCPLGRLEEPIWAVSPAALRATGSGRLQTLAAPKQLHRNYLPPREAEWSRRNRASDQNMTRTSGC